MDLERFGVLEAQQRETIGHDASAPVLMSEVSKFGGVKTGEWHVRPEGTVYDWNPAPWRDDNGGPYFAAWWCSGEYQKNGYVDIDLGDNYTLASGTIHHRGWRNACSGTCYFANGSSYGIPEMRGLTSKNFGTDADIPTACAGAVRIRLQGGGHCGMCDFKDVSLLPTVACSTSPSSRWRGSPSCSPPSATTPSSAP